MADTDQLYREGLANVRGWLTFLDQKEAEIKAQMERLRAAPARLGQPANIDDDAPPFADMTPAPRSAASSRAATLANGLPDPDTNGDGRLDDLDEEEEGVPIGHNPFMAASRLAAEEES